MKKFLAVALLAIASVFAMVSAASAQTFGPKAEVYVGYQFVRVNPKVHQPNFTFDKSTDSNGANLALTVFGTKHVGLTGELAANFSGGRSGTSLVTGLGGVTIKARDNKTVQPFLRGLVGVARERANNQQLTNVFDKSDLSLAFAAGGGVDIRVSKNVALRLVQADYLQTRLYGSTQNNLRLGAGIVF